MVNVTNRFNAVEFHMLSNYDGQMGHWTVWGVLKIPHVYSGQSEETALVWEFQARR